MSQKIAIERVDHIGIRVRDLDRALNFYRVLGFDLLRRAEGDERGNVLGHRFVEMELAILSEHRNSQTGQLFPATGQVKYRFRCNREPAPVGQSIAGGVDDGPGLDDGDSEPRAIRLDLAGDITVDPRRRRCFGAHRLGQDAIPNPRHGSIPFLASAINPASSGSRSASKPGRRKRKEMLCLPNC